MLVPHTLIVEVRTDKIPFSLCRCIITLVLPKIIDGSAHIFVR